MPSPAHSLMQQQLRSFFWKISTKIWIPPISFWRILKPPSPFFWKKSLSFIVRYFVDYFVEYYRPLLKTFSVTNLDSLSRTTTLVSCHRQKVIELLMIVFAQNNSFPKKYLSFLFHLIWKLRLLLEVKCTVKIWV